MAQRLFCINYQQGCLGFGAKHVRRGKTATAIRAMEKQSTARQPLSALAVPPTRNPLQSLYLLWLSAQLAPGVVLPDISQDLLHARIRLVSAEHESGYALIQAHASGGQMLFILTAAEHDETMSA